MNGSVCASTPILVSTTSETYLGIPSVTLFPFGVSVELFIGAVMSLVACMSVSPTVRSTCMIVANTSLADKNTHFRTVTSYPSSLALALIVRTNEGTGPVLRRGGSSAAVDLRFRRRCRRGTKRRRPVGGGGDGDGGSCRHVVVLVDEKGVRTPSAECGVGSAGRRPRVGFGSRAGAREAAAADAPARGGGGAAPRRRAVRRRRTWRRRIGPEPHLPRPAHGRQ
jgi:hypothetical protein